MNFRESVRTALGALNANKLRSVLTMLGVIIGVSAVIALLGLGNGFAASIESDIADIGSNLLFIETDFDRSDGYASLSIDDLAALEDPTRTPNIAAAGASASSGATVFANGQDFQASISGVTPDFLQIFNLVDPDDFFAGGLFTEFDAEARERTVVIGWNVAEKLFEDIYPIGERIKIGGVSYTVAGVYVDMSGREGLIPDDSVYMPMTTFEQRIGMSRTRDGRPALDFMVASARTADASDAAIEELTAVLRDTHDIAYASDDDFTIQSQADLLETVGSILGGATLFVGIVAGISLLVGGIGIMNIMLVSVTERTREIGIRKALGGLRRDILTQFIIESLFLSLIGGFIGIGLGYTFAKIGEQFVEFEPLITFSSVALAVSFSVAVGLIFGIYPAWRAARLRPIDALRYE